VFRERVTGESNSLEDNKDNILAESPAVAKIKSEVSKFVLK
jgi:hypothetical protein